jgi:hypothetical protein
MLTCWSLYGGMALVLAFAMPIAGYIAVLPLLGFSLGLPLDGFRWKKPPRLAFAALFGFLAAVYVGLYFYFQLDVVLDFRMSQFKILPLLLPSLASLPLMVWYFEGRDVRGGFSHGLLVLIAGACVAQHFVPAYTLTAPRDMQVVYVQDEQLAEPLLTLQSAIGQVDVDYATRHGFVARVLPDNNAQGKEAGAQVLARPTESLVLPGLIEIKRSVQPADTNDKRQVYTLELDVPAGVRQLVFEFPAEGSMNRALWNGVLAWSVGKEMKAFSAGNDVGINHPKAGRNSFQFEVDAGKPLALVVKARFDLPEELLQPLLEDWPSTAQPAFKGHHALTVSRLEFKN